jgi:hypothetical protein
LAEWSLLCEHGGGAGECGAGPCRRHRPWPGQQSAREGEWLARLTRHKGPPVRGHLYPRQPPCTNTTLSQQVRTRGAQVKGSPVYWRPELSGAQAWGCVGEKRREGGAGPCRRYRPWPGQQSAGPPPPNGREKTRCKAVSCCPAMRGQPECQGLDALQLLQGFKAEGGELG